MSLISPEITLLHLSLIEGIGDTTIGHIVQQCQEQKVHLSELYTLRVAELARCCQLSLVRASAVVEGLADSRLLEEEIALIEKHAIGWMTILSADYPRYLKAIHAPPAVLYWRGKGLMAEEYAIAVIGSRKVNYYGLSAIEKLVPPLVAHGWTIVSGGAIGADSKAHQVALQEGGRTIAVLGAGLLKPYPPSNKVLFDRIIHEQGTLVSPFPLAMQAFPGNFPARNRIIAGLSYGCLVVQAAAASGTHITAQFALEEGRELFAVPGPIDDPLSAGCHSLIKQGAKLVHEAQDILYELESVAITRPVLASCQSKPKDEAEIVTNVPLSSEAEIITLCKKPCTIDELAQVTGKAVQELYTILFMLEVDGCLVRQLNGTWLNKNSF